MQRTLRLMLERDISRQWGVLTAALTTTLVSEIGQEEAWRLMQRTGRNIGRQRRLPACETLGALQTAVDVELKRLDWGWARLAARDEGVDISHGAYPLAPGHGDPAGAWFAAVLEGLYTEWLGELAQNTDLTAVAMRLPETLGDVILLRYGRHGDPELPF